jgi:hypothetical protein
MKKIKKSKIKGFKKAKILLKKYFLFNQSSILDAPSPELSAIEP